MAYFNNSLDNYLLAAMPDIADFPARYFTTALIPLAAKINRLVDIFISPEPDSTDY